MSNVKLDLSKLDEIAKNLNTNLERACAAAAFEGEAMTKANINAWPAIDTGAYINSVYTVTTEQDGYGQAAGAVQSRNPGASTSPHPRPTGKVFAIFGPCVEYSAPVELGHLTKPFTKSHGVQRFIPGRPSTLPAAEQLARKINQGEFFKEIAK